MVQAWGAMSEAGPRDPANLQKPPPAPATKGGAPPPPPAKAAPPAAPPPAAAAKPVRPPLPTAPGIGEGVDTPRGPAVESSEQVQALVRTTVAEAVEAAVAETQRLVRQLERRIEELERRPAASAPTIVQAAPPATWAQAYAPAAAAPWARVAERPAPVIDPHAIDIHVEVDPVLDGGRRRRRLFLTITLFFIIGFGSLVALLAQSYSPHH